MNMSFHVGDIIKRPNGRFQYEIQKIYNFRGRTLYMVKNLNTGYRHHYGSKQMLKFVEPPNPFFVKPDIKFDFLNS